ncbi:MAG: fimbrial protein [Myxococcaceae bacterium]|nr:fimbrial protein [Myxococcaceae bacterium]
MTPNPMPAPPPQQPKKSGVSAVVIAIVAVALLCPCIGIVAAIAIPNFIKFQSRAKQSEAKMQLKSAFSAEQMYFADNQAYSTSPQAVGFSPERGNRYLIAFSADGELAESGKLSKEATGVKADAARYPNLDNDALERGIPAELMNEVGVTGKCPDDCAITIVAAGNIDNDDTIDVWSVSTKARTINGVPVAPGAPHNHVDDTRE